MEKQMLREKAMAKVIGKMNEKSEKVKGKKRRHKKDWAEENQPSGRSSLEMRMVRMGLFGVEGKLCCFCGGLENVCEKKEEEAEAKTVEAEW